MFSTWSTGSTALLSSLILLCSCGDGIEEVESDQDEEHPPGVYEGYKPSQPITGFSHKVHADIEGIDCQYCHNTASKAHSAGLPSINVCMNCHKPAGDPPTTLEDSSGMTWNQVHAMSEYLNFPDSLGQFSHAEHVQVEGLDCKTCHNLLDNSNTTINLGETCAKCHY